MSVNDKELIENVCENIRSLGKDDLDKAMKNEGLSEEEIIKEIEEWQKYDTNYTNLSEYDSKNLHNAIEGLLDLYNQRKADVNKLLRYIAVNEGKDSDKNLERNE